jgi:hypothetical protein
LDKNQKNLTSRGRKTKEQERDRTEIVLVADCTGTREAGDDDDDSEAAEQSVFGIVVASGLTSGGLRMSC